MAAVPRKWLALEREIVSCERCPRLRDHCRRVAVVKRRAYRDESYWGRPLPGFGDPQARVLIVGLAPAAHGGNRTGRIFTGDRSGDWLFAALYEAGLANQPHSIARDDGLRLRGARITAAARCAPPGNKPTPFELANCAPYLDREFELLTRLRVVVALGRIAWDAVLRRERRVARAAPRMPRPRFAHAAQTELSLQPGRPPLVLLGSYHPSQQNTLTGRLTRPMLSAVMHRAAELGVKS
jgi:uracil-DNA glycosylase family 4